MSKCRESYTLKSVCSNTKYQTPAKKSLKDSGNMQRLHRLSEVYNTQVQYIVMNSQKAPQTVEVSQQQYTGMNVDVLVIWRHTDGAGTRTGSSLMYEWKETLSSHKQRHVSTIRGVQELVLRQGERRERSEQNTVKDAQWEDRCRGFRWCS